MKSRLALAVLLLASLAASSQTVTVNYKVFGGGELLPPFSVFHATPDGNIILGVPKQILVQDPTNPNTPPKTYAFLFWLVPGGPTISTEAIFKAPPGGAHTTAWYQLTGPCATPPCEPMSYASAFSENDDQQIPGTPISSVTPSGLWTDPNNYVKASNQPVVITAKPSMDNQEFHVWLQFSTADISGNTLHVPAKQTTSAIAFYHTVNIPPPPPPPCLQQWEKAIGDAIKALQDAEKLLPGPFKDEKVKEATKALQDAVAGEQACMKNTNKPKVVKAK